jgi:hypothetical protein
LILCDWKQCRSLRDVMGRAYNIFWGCEYLTLLSDRTSLT